METTINTATVGQVCAMQVVVPEWLRDLRDAYGDDQQVIVRRKVTPFGTFLVGVEVVEEPAPDAWLDDMGE